MNKFFLSIWISLVASNFVVCHAAPNVTSLGALSAQFHGPARVAATADGNLYVTDPATGRVVEVDAFGQQVAVREGFAGPLAIAVASDGRIYLSEEKTGSVSVFDAQWNRLYQLGVGRNEFQLASHLAVDPLAPATVYVSDSPANLVRVYSGTNQVGQFGGAGTGDGQFSFPAGISVCTNGEVVVVDQNNDRVEVFTNGFFARTFSLQPGSSSSVVDYPQALFVDNEGRAFVTDSMQAVVKVFDVNDGLLLGTVGEFGKSTGQLNMPVGVVLDGLNRLYVACANNARIELFGVDSFLNFSVSAPGGKLAAGNDLIFTVTSGGAGRTFQWQKNGVNLVGETNTTLVISRAGTGDTGAYAVVVDGATNNAAPVSVLAAPALWSAPVDQRVIRGALVNFVVLADGSDLKYQWQFNGQDLADATNSTLVLTDVQAAQSGRYSVQVTNAVGALVTPPANLTVLTPPLVMEVVSAAQPVGQAFQMTFNTDPGYNYDLQATLDFVDWQTITSFSGNGLFDFSDVDSTNYPNRFYRLKWVP